MPFITQGKTNLKYILIGLVIILVTISITGGLILHFLQKSQERAELKFSVSPCDPDIPTYDQSKLGIKEIEWLDESTLQVKAYVNINCEEEIESGSYEIIGNKIILKYKSPLCKMECKSPLCTPCALCICGHELVYRFTNLEKKDYQFELKRIGVSESTSESTIKSELESELFRIRTEIELYYAGNNGSYIGFTTVLTPPECSGDAYVVQISPDGQEYLAYARLCDTEENTFFCVDSSGNSKKVVVDSMPDDIYTCP